MRGSCIAVFFQEILGSVSTLLEERTDKIPHVLIRAYGYSITAMHDVAMDWEEFLDALHDHVYTGVSR
jgi:hypothetical protein